MLMRMVKQFMGRDDTNDAMQAQPGASQACMRHDVPSAAQQFCIGLSKQMHM